MGLHSTAGLLAPRLAAPFFALSACFDAPLRGAPHMAVSPRKAANAFCHVTQGDLSLLHMCCRSLMEGASCCAVHGALQCLSLFADELSDDQVIQVRGRVSRLGFRANDAAKGGCAVRRNLTRHAHTNQTGLQLDCQRRRISEHHCCVVVYLSGIIKRIFTML